MNRYGYADSVGYEHKILVAVRQISSVFPFKNEPEYQCRAEWRKRVDLALYRRKPKGVAPCISECAAKTGAEYNRHSRQRHRHCIVFDQQPAHQMSYSPEQQQYSSGAKQCRHCVYASCHLADISPRKVYKETPGEHEDRVARRVSDFKFESLQNKFGTVPKTRSRLYCKQIGNSGNDKAEPAKNIIKDIVALHFGY